MYKFGHPFGVKKKGRGWKHRFRKHRQPGAGVGRPLLAPCQPLIERKPAINITFLFRGADFIMARSPGDGSGCAISVTYAPGLYGFIFRIALRAIKL